METRADHVPAEHGGADPSQLITQTRRLSLVDSSSSTEYAAAGAVDPPDTSAAARPEETQARRGNEDDDEAGRDESRARGGEGIDEGSDSEPCFDLAIWHRSLLGLGSHPDEAPSLEHLPTELLLCVLSFLDVCDLLATSRVNHLLRTISLAPILHYHRLQRSRTALPPLLWSPSRPSLADLIARSIFLTNTSVVSRRLGRSLVSIRLSRRLAARPSAEALVQRAVLPQECVPGMASPVHVAPAIVARRRAIERERVKDGLRRWVAAKWRREVREREEMARRRDESRGVGRVWRLRRFWESLGRGDSLAAR